MARLISLNVGLPRDVPWRTETVHTAVWKSPVSGPRRVRRLNIDGDGQGDLTGHGGKHRAVLVYQIESYHFWREQLNRNDFTYGQFGENFTVDGLSDKDVCIGDRYRIGNALFEVTQPRVTCYRVGIRMNEPRMASLLVAHGRPGFYLRVLEEGEVAAGDEIVREAVGTEQMTVAEIDALLYMPGHPLDKLQRALRIPALSAGWRASLEALVGQQEAGKASGNAGLALTSDPPPAWAGFRGLRVTDKVHESRNVTSLVFEPADGHPLAAPLPGQFVVVRLTPSHAAATLTRSYSLSGPPSAEHYRVSVKREQRGAAGRYIDEKLQVGDVLGVSAPRGSFTLLPGNGSIVFLSAGIGVTPVLAMLHALAAGASTRDVWWLHGARNGREHPFAREARSLLKELPRAHGHVRYSAPGTEDRLSQDFDAIGRLDVDALQELGVPLDADFYLCGPPAFLSGLTSGLASRGVAAARIHSEMFGSVPAKAPGIVALPRRPPHLPPGPTGEGSLVSFARSGLSVRWRPAFQSLLELAEACDIPVRWSCRSGVCHTCESGMVSGQVCYEPDPIDPPSDGQVLICCSRPEGDIVVDL